MPHGHLTPLGRQLRSVLANLSIPRRVQVHSQARARHIRASNGQPKASRSKEEEDKGTFRTHRWKRLKLPSNTEQLSAVIEDAEQTSPRWDISSEEKQGDVKASNQTGPKEAITSNVKQLSLDDILSRCLQSEGRERDPMQAEWEPSFVPSVEETAHLHSKGLTTDDICDIADISRTYNSNEAAEKLSVYVNSGRQVALFVLMHLLRRECISANALRTIIISFSSLLERKGDINSARGGNAALMGAIVHLIRHAREVWPQSLASVVSLFLGHLQHQDATQNPASMENIQDTTSRLNKLMRLVSLSTALHPLKDNVFQEMAIISILRYMDAHDPPLQITREGWRAVVRIQLAQRKTPNEQQWAQLKALSWPPWKVDRTAMDTSVGLEYGISRARATLISMRNAGYAPLLWERAAEVYTGWDPDGTPTVQRRVMLDTPAFDDCDESDDTSSLPSVLQKMLGGYTSPEDLKTSIPWAARIDSTRTIQEAWACYLAWEDSKLPPDQHVYLNIMQKLQEQTKNQHDDDKSQSEPRNPAWYLLPGDTPRLSPLPPSTHLYTYTRTLPPSLEDFYTMTRGRGVQFTGYTLSFLLRVSPLQTGLSIIKDSLPQYPELAGVLTLDPAHDLSSLHPDVFCSAVQLLARSGGYFLNAREWKYRDSSSNLFPDQYPKDHTLEILHLNRNSVIVRAVELLRRRPNSSRQTWVAVFKGLTRESNFPGLGQAVPTSNRQLKDLRSAAPEDAYVGALLAYSMTKRLISLYREHFSDLDPMAFQRACLAAESMVWAVWRVMLLPEQRQQERDVKERTVRWDHDRRYIRSGIAGKELRKEFWSLVGTESGGSMGNQEAVVVFGGEQLPNLLSIPNPAMLHAYIRALGWLADYRGLSELVYWMRCYNEEIMERAGRDRSGRDMMRKAMVALRVFLERSWRVNGDDEVRRKLQLLPMTTRPDVDVRLSEPAENGLVEEVKEIVDSVDEWEGWATEMEVEEYISDGRFDGLRG